jgi:hypothetical protein
MCLTMDLNDNFSECAGFNKGVRRVDVPGRKSPLVKKGFQLACFRERRCLLENLAMMCAVFARNQGK